MNLFFTLSTEISHLLPDREYRKFKFLENQLAYLEVCYYHLIITALPINSHKTRTLILTIYTLGITRLH
jgi:hypothetical protein